MINEARMRMVMVGNGAALVALMGLTACGGSKGSGGQDGGDGGNGNCPPQTAPALMCTPGVSPANPLITDFTDGGGWCASSGKWGTTGNLVGSLFSYIKRSAATIVRIYAMYEPLKVFTYIGLTIFGTGVAGGLRFLYYLAFVNRGTGHLQSLILSAVLMIVGFQVILIGLLADVISANRKLLGLS